MLSHEDKKYFFLFFLIANINYPITNKCNSKQCILFLSIEIIDIDGYSLHDFRHRLDKSRWIYYLSKASFYLSFGEKTSNVIIN